MSIKLFVGGLSWDTSEQSFQNAFSAYGDIEEARIITDRDTGRSRGFGFITFSEKSSGITAISEMDGSELDGRTIKVNQAEDKPAGSGGGRRPSNNRR
ncbi:MAG: RNA-binding protein [Spirochaetia bacterium]|nr:RNA-binding protein [Spirochaetia bacterium]